MTRRKTRFHSYSSYIRWFDRAYAHGNRFGVSFSEDKHGYYRHTLLWFWDKDSDSVTPLGVWIINVLPSVGTIVRMVDYMSDGPTKWKTYKIVEIGMTQDETDTSRIMYDAECEEIKELAEL